MHLSTTKWRAALTGGLTLRSLPWVTLATALVCLGLTLSGSPNQLYSLCFDYAAITQGNELWRLFSAHFVHSSINHLFWDLIAFTACAGYVEYKAPKIVIPAMLCSLLVLNLFLLSPLTSVQQYSGLSGVLYTFLCLACWLWLRSEHGLAAWIPALIVVAKTLLEMSASSALFVTEGWHIYYPAHLVGWGAGMLFLLLRRFVIGHGS